MIAPLLLLFPTVPAVPTVRVAFSNDGNFHDRDDIGASAMMQALLWRAGARRSLVYIEHSSHIDGNSSSQHSRMVESATGHAVGFDIDPDRIFDNHTAPGESAAALAGAIDLSAAGRPLVFFQAGPWESMARGFDLADPTRHQFVTIVSHSDWNDNHEHVASHRDKADFFAQYEAGGLFEGFTPPRYVRIDDQNSYAFKSSVSAWSWLADDPDLAFVLERTLASGSAAGDMSDAGMVFWFLTGIEHPTMDDVRNFLE